jgi:acyl-CoA reductase-like NAD-dependent aldehyde dehydrogenase
VVLKPSPETALDAYLLAEALVEIGLPPGVVNVVVADRATSEYLVTHPDVDKVAFTGSTAAGRKIAAACGDLLRPVTLELGGKSAAIVLDDADVAQVAETLMPMASMMLSGQACIAQTRILAPRSRYDEVVEALTEKVRSLAVGDPFDPNTIIGPLVAARQRDRVESYIALGQQEGAKVTVGGGRPAHLPRGWYVEPTVLTNVDNHMRVAQEEIFGPVAVVIPYEDTDDAIRLANQSDYGLGGGVYTADPARGLDVARQMTTGTVTLNGIGLETCAPFGGVKQSGLGRELGPEGLAAYFNLKSIMQVPPA